MDNINTNITDNAESSISSRDLNDRERDILSSIVQLYILSATPIGSRNLAKHLERDLKLSPATIRNVMSDLEELEYISHPHTSAGRVPTDKGYRFYVNSIQKSDNSLISNSNNYYQKLDNFNIDLSSGNTELILKDASKILGMLSHYLAVVRIPYLNDIIVRRIELIPVSSAKLLIILALDSNIVRTMTIELLSDFNPKLTEAVSSAINDRISGKSISFIRDNFINIIQSLSFEDTPLIRLFVDSIYKLFTNETGTEKIHVAGTQNLLSQPEFDHIEKVKGIIELVENEDVIIHLLDKTENLQSQVNVLIGAEMQNEQMQDYSLVVSQYQLGSAKGAIGLIGPKRMNYSKVISLVQFMAETLTSSK